MPWLLGIAYRVLLDLRRRASTTREVAGALPEIASEQQTGDERVQAREAQALVQEALLSLDEDRRDAFVLCDLQGLSPAEVAQTMGAPVATTYSRLRVAREEFTAAVRRIKLRRGEQ